GLGDGDSDVCSAMEATGRFAVVPLGRAHRQLADRVAGLLPAPGGLFAAGDWRDAGYGPLPADAGTWAGCRLASARPFGWSLLVEATIERIELGGADEPLVHYRGQYRELRR